MTAYDIAHVTRIIPGQTLFVYFEDKCLGEYKDRAEVERDKDKLNLEVDVQGWIKSQLTIYVKEKPA